MRYYAYLRASTTDQDANRAKESIQDFANLHNFKVSAWFIENVSGATLQRPELQRLLDVAEGDAIVVEQIDRLTRLNDQDWQTLKSSIKQRNVKIISLDLPTSHQMINDNTDITQAVMSLINELMLDLMAIFARKDFETRRERQKQGIEKAKTEFPNKYKGRKPDLKKYEQITLLLNSRKADGGKYSYTDIQKLLGCSRHTISKAKKLSMEQDCT